MTFRAVITNVNYLSDQEAVIVLDKRATDTVYAGPEFFFVMNPPAAPLLQESIGMEIEGHGNFITMGRMTWADRCGPKHIRLRNRPEVKTLEVSEYERRPV